MPKKVWIAAVVVVAAIVIVVVALNRLHTPTPGSVRVGRILPLTGRAASYGKSEQQGTLLALEEINATGGIGGSSLEILFED